MDEGEADDDRESEEGEDEVECVDDDHEEDDEQAEHGEATMAEVREMLAIPEDVEALQAEEVVGFDAIRTWYELLFSTFCKAYQPSTTLVIDETMFAWVGATDAQLIAMKRKPTPLGFCTRTLADSYAGICINGDLVEGTTADAAKEFSGEWKPHTAVTLRVTKPYHNGNKIVIGDSYFGSLSTAIALA